MSISGISIQLKHDYPGHSVYIDAENRMVRVDEFKNVLLLSSSAIEGMDIFSSSGKHFYQIIVNLIYTKFNILPEEGTYADSLVIRREDVRAYKMKRLAELYKLGFLEAGDSVKAVEVDNGESLPPLLEDYHDDPLEDEEFEGSLQYYRYSLWREEDSSLEELESADDDGEDLL